MKFKYFIYAALFLVPLLIDGCVPSKPTEQLEILPSERLINKLEVNRRRIKNFEGYGTLSVKSARLNNSANFRIVILKPDSIYLTIYGPFGLELAQSIVTGEDFIFYDALNNTAYKGKISDDVLNEIFKINLSFRQLLDAFVGSVDLTPKLYRSPDKFEIIYDEYMLTYIDSLTNNREKYTIDVRELGIKNFSITNHADEIFLDSKYSKFQLIESVAVPNKIEMNNFKDDQAITIEYKTTTVNKKNLFVDFFLPSDANVIEW